MKRTILAASVAALMSTGAYAQSIGATIAAFDDNWLTVMRLAMVDSANAIDGVEIQVEDAGNDVGKQLNQIQNFVASGVDVIIVNPVDTDATVAMTNVAAEAGIPLVFLNREPVNVNEMPDNQALVASNEIESGTLEAFEVCKLLRSAGKAGGANVVVMMGQLSNQAAVQRTKDVEDIVGIDMCSFMTIVEKQTANWSRVEAQDLMTNWLSAGVEFDAVIANNDEMAIGAIQAMKAAGIDMADVVVGGVDATSDALAAMQAGDLDVTVFQDAAGQGGGAVRTALALVAGEDVDQKVFIPFKLVTPANIGDFLGGN
jgi:inositol transport system substrate-binding protein